jgi:hypothetical protein
LAPLKPIYAVHKNGQGIFLHCNIRSNAACLGQPRRLPIGNHKPVRISRSQALGMPAAQAHPARLNMGPSVFCSLWTTILSLPGGTDGSHLLQTGISPSATVLMAIAAFLLLLTKI